MQMHQFYPELSCLASGLLVSCFTTPLDVIKNFWIYHPKFKSSHTRVTITQVIRCLYKIGGVRNFFTGLSATCFTIVLTNYVFFKFYEKLLPNSIPALAVPFNAFNYVLGIAARVVAVIITSPFEYIRTRLQANAGTISCIKLLYHIKRFDDIFALTNGIGITLFRDVPFSAVYWTLNEHFKKILFQGRSNYPDCLNDPTTKGAFLYPFVSGGIAAGVSCALTQPLDVIKTNIQGYIKTTSANDLLSQQRYISYYSIVRKIYACQKWKGFYVGLLPRLIKIIPSCGIMLASYDFSKTIYLKKYQAKSTPIFSKPKNTYDAN